MEIDEEGSAFVRVIIATAKRGSTSISKPMKTISIRSTNVEEVYEIVFDSIRKECKKGENARLEKRIK